MRFIIPNYSQEDNFTNNVAHTLLKMGHEVLTVPKPSSVVDHRFMHILQIVYDKVFPLKLMPQEKWLKKVHHEFKPDVVLALTQQLDESLLQELRNNGAVTVSWWGDTPANMRKQGLLVNGWDYIFIKDNYAAFKMRTVGLNAHYLPEAMNPDWHVKCYSRIGTNLCFAGNAYNYRHYLIRKLIEAGYDDITLYGDRPPRWASEALKGKYMNRFIVKEEKSKVFGESFACINSTAMSEGNSLNCRSFEIAGAGGLQVLEYRPAVEDCFEPGKEIVTYSSFEELTEVLTKYKTDVKEAEMIRSNGNRRALQEHTYKHRLETILKKIGKI
jgi:spore maturation protein CgeB